MKKKETQIIENFISDLGNKQIECQSNFCKKKIGTEIFLGSVNNGVFLFCSKKCRNKQLEYSRMFLGEFVYEVFGDK